LGTEVVSAEPVDGRHVRLHLSDGTERTVDHVISATGFRIDVARYPFLGDSVKRGLDLFDGYPVLGTGLESSIPNLHFLGALAAWSYGPRLRFVSGTWFASRSLVAKIAGR